MLKFLRKYQLILLAVGGSLLMVVFLLEPVLRQLTPDPRKRTVATIGGDIEITMGERSRANIEVELLTRYLSDFPMILGLDADEPGDHWLLLKHEAERMGVMGVAQDGADWIPELTYILAQQQVNMLQRQGQPVTQEQADELQENTRIFLQRQQDGIIQANRISDQVFYETLSKARGVLRLRRLFGEAPRLSRQRLLDAFDRQDTRVLIDQVVLGPELLAGEVVEPTDAELARQLETYNAYRPGETFEGEGGEFGFGYLLPSRIKLEWLALDPASINSAVTADPVQVRRRWQESGDQSVPFSEARAQIETEIKRERVGQILVDADEIIRGEILNSTRGLEKEGIYRRVPEGWTAPDLERIAGAVVDAVQERHGVRIPRPTVERRSEGWLTPTELGLLPGVGQAVYRVGTRQTSVSQMPSAVRGIGDDTTVAVQVGIPVVEPVAVNMRTGARYYVTVLDAVAESPPASMEEIRDQLVADVKAKAAYELLESRLDVYRETATRDGLDALVAMFAGNEASDSVQKRENILVTTRRMGPATFQSFPDSRADRPGFRDAVMAEAEDISPLADPDSTPLGQSVVGVSLPSSRVVAFGRVRAKIPGTAERFRAQVPMVTMTERIELLSESPLDSSPLDLSSMTDRLGFVLIGEDSARDTPGDAAPAEG